MKLPLECAEAFVRAMALVELRGMKMEDLPTVMPDFFKPRDIEISVTDATPEDLKSGHEEIDRF